MGFTSTILFTSIVLAPQAMVQNTAITPLPQIVAGTTVESELVESEEITQSAETEEMTERDYSDVPPESDLWLLAHVVSGEAHNCDRVEMEYVASVVMNRVRSDKFPDTVSDVVYQTNPIQYACVYDGSGNFQQEPSQENWEEAEYILDMYNEEGYTVLPDDVVWQSQVPQGVGTYVKTQYHYYCY